ncbi:MAG: nucleotidyl transferase AbiEii/AbiGii toxin family protein [Bacteroidales bacterium]|nr:nucleotidyl transferase AbiEii/AbiGii toxin family protein [Bacteroidales bacterium]
MLQIQTVAPATFDLLRRLQNEEILSSTRLVGGTSLALQIGHRTSVDLDFFSCEEMDIQGVQELLFDKYDFTPGVITGKSILGVAEGVKLDIIYHPFKWIDDIVPGVEGIRLASTKEIAAMILHAIINSGKRPKDFLDLAFLSKYYSYDEMVGFLLEKYPRYDPMMANRAVNYFEDVDKQEIPEIQMFGYKLNWGRVEKRLLQITKNPDKAFDADFLLNQ